MRRIGSDDPRATRLAKQQDAAASAMLAALQSIRVWLIAPDLSQDTLDHFALTAATALTRAKEAGIK